MSLTLIWPFNVIQGQMLSGKLKTERPYMTYYMHFIQTLIIRCTVSGILAEIDHKDPNWIFLALKMTFRASPYLSYFSTGLVSPQTLIIRCTVTEILAEIDHKGPFLPLKWPLEWFHTFHIIGQDGFTTKKLHDVINVGSTSLLLNNINNYGKIGQTWPFRPWKWPFE